LLKSWVFQMCNIIEYIFIQNLYQQLQMKLLFLLFLIAYNIHTAPYYTCSINDAPNNTMGFTEDLSLLRAYPITIYKAPPVETIPTYIKILATLTIIGFIGYDIVVLEYLE
jgi:hypothetical protein